MKRNITWIALVCMAVILTTVGSVNAYMRKQTEVVENVFTPAVVTCKVVESFANKVDKTDVAIQNTGNIDAYLRLRFVTYWIDSHGDIIFDESKTLVVNNNTADDESKVLRVDYDTTNWILKDDIFYYIHPVAPGAVTTDLLKPDAKITLTTLNGHKQVVEVFAEAIQRLPKDAVEESWRVKVGADRKLQLP